MPGFSSIVEGRRGFLRSAALLGAAALGGCLASDDPETSLDEWRTIEGQLCEESNPLWVLEYHDWQGFDPIDPAPELEELDPDEDIEEEAAYSPASPGPAGRRTYVLSVGGADKIFINVEANPNGADFDAVISTTLSGKTRGMKMKGRWRGGRWVYTGVDVCEGRRIVLVLGFGKPRLGCRVVIDGQRVFQGSLPAG